MSWYFKTEEYSSLYNKYRFDYPKSLYHRILEFLKQEDLPNDGRWTLAVDVGCGTGQHTWPLTEHFDHVIGTDLNETQLKQARQNHDPLKNVTFKQGEAHHLEFLADGSVDLVTAGMALHWFDREKFYRECQRVLRPGGILAAVGFVIDLEDDEGKNMLDEFYHVDLAGYLEEASAHVLDRYSDLYNDFSKSFFSYTERDESTANEKDLAMDDILGFLKTTTLLRKYRSMNPTKPDPLIKFSERLEKVYAGESLTGTETKIVNCPTFLLLGRK